MFLEITIEHSALCEPLDSSPGSLKKNIKIRNWFSYLTFELRDLFGNRISYQKPEYVDRAGTLSFETQGFENLIFVIDELGGRVYFKLNPKVEYYHLNFSYENKRVVLTEQTEPTFYEDGSYTPPEDTDVVIVQKRVLEDV